MDRGIIPLFYFHFYSRRLKIHPLKIRKYQNVRALKQRIYEIVFSPAAGAIPQRMALEIRYVNKKGVDRLLKDQVNFKWICYQINAFRMIAGKSAPISEPRVIVTRNPTLLLKESSCIKRFSLCRNRLVILGFKCITASVDDPRRRGEKKIEEMKLVLHPELKGPLAALCNLPNTTVVVLSGSRREVLDDIFGDFNMWLAAEHGMFLRSTMGEWMTTMPKHLKMDCFGFIKKLFDHFTGETPGSFVELRETSFIWNYKYADVETGSCQAKLLLQRFQVQRLQTSASTTVFEGTKSVEVRLAGVTKGAALSHILTEIGHTSRLPFDYVLCLGRFTQQDQDVYTFFETELPSDGMSTPKTKVTDAMKFPVDPRSALRDPTSKSSSHPAENKFQGPLLSSAGPSSPETTSWKILDLNKENYFSCAVSQTKTSARYVLNSPKEVVAFIKELAESSNRAR